jgi:MFS family permease
MSDRFDDHYQVSPRNPDGSRGRRPVRGPHVGSFRLTATRVMLTIAVAGSTAFVAYAFLVRDATQIPLLVAGFAVLGLVFAMLAVTGVIATYRAGSEGRAGRATAIAILGGVAAILSLACFAGAVLGALVYRG